MKYLTFMLDTTVYAAEISQVLEVLDYENPQTIPCPDKVIAGIIRSRNRSITVINLHRKFGSPDKEPTKKTKIIVFELQEQSSDSISWIGAITDSVLEVLDIDDNSLEPPPETGHDCHTEFITGISRNADHFVIVLDFSKLFASDELTRIITISDSSNTAGKAEKV